MERQSDNEKDLSNVPTDMESDPTADERVIDQTGSNVKDVPEEVNPSGLEKPTAAEGTTPLDDLANALAYALDGSGTGMAGAPPIAPTVGEAQKIASEGTTGAGPEDEEDDLTDDR
jgi:hypothetical protein